jgi:gliding motility-associated-like protein
MMKMKIVKHLLLFTIMVMCQHAFAQKQNNQWRFGNGGGIDFNTIPPSNVSGAAITTPEGSASVADRTTGSLLFYTNGLTVWNTNNQVMPNGTGLLGGTPTLLSSTTAAVIIPKPGSNNLYYIVTIDEQSSNSGVRYTVVDMNLNSGLGDVVAGQKNIFLFQTTSEKLEVVPASDGVSYWLLTHDEPGNSFFSFRVSSAGIQSTPVVSTTGATQANGAGHMKINRQFDKLAIGVTFSSTIELYDFDNSTGVVSNPISWNYNLSSPLIYGIEFSPNGKVLYISNLDKLLQFDITPTTSSAIENSEYQLPTGFSQPASLQLAIDDKIYINSGSVNVINCPNKLGAACGFQPNAIANQSGGGGYGLPKWVYYTDDLPAITSNAISYADSCLGNATQFLIQNTAGISSITWNFGDPSSGVNNTSTSLTPTHLFSTTGTYNIRSIVNFTCGVDTIYKTISIVNCDSIKEDCQLFVPNAFTPNGDGANDNFHPLTICKFEQYEFFIFNRWGGLVFKTSNQTDNWDGSENGVDCSSDVYVYLIKYKFPTQQVKITSGSITLLR